mgnify:CR=1 FL=1
MYKRQGYTPYNAYYNISEQDIQRGVVQVQPCQAVWMSGATEQYRNQFPVNSDSHSYQVTVVSRNVSDADVQFDSSQRAAYQAQQKNDSRYRAKSSKKHLLQSYW